MHRLQHVLLPQFHLGYPMSVLLYIFAQSLACRGIAVPLFVTDGSETSKGTFAPENWRQTLNQANPEEIAEYFGVYGKDILSFLRRRVSSLELAEDLMQQVFLRLMDRSDWTEVRNPEAYLRATARHVLADFYRKQNSRDKGVVLEYQEFRHADETWNPDNSLHSQEFVDRLADVLESLSPNVRRACVLSRVSGYTYRQVGEMLTISPRTVEKHIAKAAAHCVESELNARDEQMSDERTGK